MVDQVSSHIIGEDITILRDYYDEALQMQGVPAKYQYPLFAESNNQGEPVIDSYSDFIPCFVFFEDNPKIKTYRRYGWVVENSENLPFLLHCSFHTPKLQKDSVFRISGQYSEVEDRIFRVTEISYDLQCPDHLVCKVVPCYEEQITGRTKTEVATTFDKSNHFLKPAEETTDYKGNYRTFLKGDK